MTNLIIISLVLFAITLIVVWVLENKRTSRPKNLQHLSASPSSKGEFQVEYNSLVETFRKKDLFFVIECGSASGPNYEFIFGFGMYQKLQLNGLRVDGAEIWFGQIYLDIGGPSKIVDYVFNQEFFRADALPDVFFYAEEGHVESITKGFGLSYKISKSLRKELVISPVNMDCDWRHLPKESLDVEVNQKIKESAIQITRSGSFNIHIFTGGVSDDVNGALSEGGFVVLASRAIQTISLDASRDYKFAFLSRNILEGSEPDSVAAKTKIGDLVCSDLYSNFQCMYEKSKGYCCNTLSQDQKFQHTPLSIQNVSLGESKNGAYRKSAKVSIVLSNSSEQLSVEFFPQHVLDKELLMIWEAKS